ncbi:MAG: sulfurtransferase-like selenium metabolism protein YedF [Pelovirga sp.]
MLEFDYRGHQCPYPVVETRKQILAHPGQRIRVLVDDEICRDNLLRLVEKMAYQAAVQRVATGYELDLTPPLQHPGPAATPSRAAATAAAGTVIYCGSDQMGSGDADFGRVLLRNFLMTQLELVPLPRAILFVNSGIHLTTAGSEALEALEALASAGVDIASCGLCLDFYQKKQQLKVGRVTNMLDIAEIQQQAARVVCP